MRILKLEIDNYGAFYGHHEWALADQGLVMVLGDNRDEPRMNSNGAAKSTGPDCLDWTLFGVVPRGDHVDSIINEESKCVRGIAYIEDDDGKAIRVQRQRKWEGETRGLRVWIGEHEVTALDDKETQAILEQALGLDRQIFHAAILFAQTDDFNFADASDSERLEILSKVYQLDVIDDWADKAKKLRSECEAQVNSRLARIAQFEGELQGLAAIDYTAHIAAFEQQRAAKLAEITKSVSEVRQYLAHAQAQLAGEAEARAYLAEVERSRPQLSVPALDPRFNDAVTAAHSDQAQVFASIHTVETKLAKVRALRRGDCSACGQPITEQHVAAEVARMEAEIAALKADVPAKQAALKAALDQRAHAQHFIDDQVAAFNTVALPAFQAALTTAQQRVAHFDATRRYIETTTAAHDSLLREHETVRTQANPSQVQQQTMLDRKAQVEHMHLADRQLLETEQSVLAHVDFWVTGLGPKGLKSYFLDSRLQEMTDAANEWVKILTGGTIWIRFETQTMGRSTGKLSNKINIRVFRYNRNGTITERNYRSWSGGEKKRVSWGISFGFSRLVAARARKRYDLLILDEVFKFVDRAGRDAVVEMLRYLKREKSSVFVIEHDADFQSAFERSLLVRKENGRSKFVEVASGSRAQEGVGGGEENAAGAGGTPADGGVRADPDVPRRRPTRQPVKSGAASSSGR